MTSLYSTHSQKYVLYLYSIHSQKNVLYSYTLRNMYCIPYTQKYVLYSIHSQKNVSVVQYLLQQANIKSLKITFINLEHWTGPSWSWLEKSELERLFWLAKNITRMAMTRMIMTRLLWNSIDCIITTMNVPRLWLSYTVERRILYISHKNSHTTTVRLLRISYLTDLERDSS